MTFMTTNLVMGVFIFVMFWRSATTKGSNSNTRWATTTQENKRQTIATQGEEEQHKANNNNKRGETTTQSNKRQVGTTQGEQQQQQR